MAYAFPSSETGGPPAPTSHPIPSGKSSRKGSEEGFDVLKEFKVRPGNFGAEGQTADKDIAQD